MQSSNQKMLLNEKAWNRDQRKMGERPDSYGKQRRKNVMLLNYLKTGRAVKKVHAGRKGNLSQTAEA